MDPFWTEKPEPQPKTAKTLGLGPRLKFMRESNGLSHMALAKITGISKCYIGQLERGYREPTAHKVALLAKALGCTTDHLILGEER